MKQPILLSLFLLGAATLKSQTFTLQGKITDNSLEPLAYVSIQVKELQSGTVSKADGRFQLSLEEGKYDLVVSMTGYISRIITLVVTRNTTQNIILEKDSTRSLSEIIVKGKYKDRAEEILRMVIAGKESQLRAPGAYSCKLYIKAVQYDSSQALTKKRALPDTAGKM